MFGEPLGAGGAGGSGAGGGGGSGGGGRLLEMPHVVPRSPFMEPGIAFRWQFPSCAGLALAPETHSHAMQFFVAAHVAQHPAADVSLLHLKAFSVQDSPGWSRKGHCCAAAAAA